MSGPISCCVGEDHDHDVANPGVIDVDSHSTDDLISHGEWIETLGVVRVEHVTSDGCSIYWSEA